MTAHPLRQRMMDPSTGRFLTLDPFAGNLEDPQSLNKYLYTQDDPINFDDPAGRSEAAVMSVYAMLTQGVGAPNTPANLRGSRLVTLNGDYRQLTVNEIEMIQYVYKAVMPGLFSGTQGDYRIGLLSTTLHQVRLWDFGSVSGIFPFFPIAAIAINIRGNQAITNGNDQYYKNFPIANSPGSFGMVAHESFHSFQVAMLGDSRSAFLLAYTLDSIYEGISYAAPYERNWSEMIGTAIELTVNDMVKDDPLFVRALATGDPTILPASTKTVIRSLFKHYIFVQKNKYPRFFK